MGKPVVASRLPMVERTFPPKSVATYDPGNPESMAAAILSLVEDPEARAEAIARTAEIVRASAWETEAVRYIELVDRLSGEAGIGRYGTIPDPSDPPDPPSPQDRITP
jgi:glycosyltransferase involved in cell wall biosynthesis